MTPDQVLDLTKRIARMYAFVERDEIYMDIWVHVAKDADYDLTIQKFYAYLSDPTHARRPPMPADIIAKPQPKDGFEIEREQMQQWESEAKAHPPDWNQALDLMARIGVSDDE